MTDHMSVNKALLGFVFLALAAMLAWSFVYRTQNPSLVAAVNPGAQMPSGMGEGAMGNEAMEMVMAAMQKLKANPEDVQALEEAAEAFAQAGMWDKALPHLEKAYAKKPKEPHVLNLLGVTLFRLEKPAEAAKKFEEMLSLDPGNFQAQFNLGAVYKHGLNSMAQAKPLFEAVLANPAADLQTKDQARQELAGQ